MQQSYRTLRVIAEAQTIRIVLPMNPDELALHELYTACTPLTPESWSGIKAVVLDFGSLAGNKSVEEAIPATIERACHAVRALEQPVLAVVRDGTLSLLATQLMQEADLMLVTDAAYLTMPAQEAASGLVSGAEAARLGFVTWTTPVSNLKNEMERILDMLRSNSAIVLRHAKASVRIGARAGAKNADATHRLERLQEVNAFYLQQVMQTSDAQEGLHAFLEKRNAQWKNQ